MRPRKTTAKKATARGAATAKKAAPAAKPRATYTPPTDRHGRQIASDRLGRPFTPGTRH